MRITHVLTLIGAAVVSFSAAAAPAVTASVSTSDMVASVPVVGKVGYKLRAADYARLQGHYELSDGRVLQVTMNNGKLYAEVDNAKAEIVQGGYNKFVSRDDALRVVFDSVEFPTEVALSLARN